MWHDGGDELPFDPSIIIIFAPKVRHCNTKSCEAAVHIFGRLSLIHDEVFLFTIDLVELGALDACIPGEQGLEMVPNFFGGGECTNMCHIGFRDSLLENVNSRSIELLLDFFAWGQVEWIARRKPKLHTSP